MLTSFDKILLGNATLQNVSGQLTFNGSTVGAGGGGSGGGAGNTDQLPEGTTNLYFTNTRAINATLSGFTLDYGDDVTENDTIVGAIGKLEHKSETMLSAFGGTVSGNLSVSGSFAADRVRLSSVAQGYSGSVVLDFDNKAWVVLGQLTANTSFATTNRGDGKEMSVKILGDASSTRTLSFPAWVWIGGVAPSSIAAAKTAIIGLRCFGTNESDVVASYAVQS